MNKKDLFAILILFVSNVIWLIPTEGGHSSRDMAIVTIVNFAGWILAIGIIYCASQLVTRKFFKANNRIKSFEISLILYLALSLLARGG